MNPPTQAYEHENELEEPTDVLHSGRQYYRQYEADDLEEAWELPLAWESWVLEVRLEADVARERFLPEVPATDDRKRYPPPVDDMPDETVDYFQRRAEETRHASLRTRYLEFLWERTGEFKYVRRALAAYREAIREGIEAEAEASDLKRLAQWGFGLAATVQEQEGAMLEVADELLTHMSDDPGGHFLRTVEAAVPLLVKDDDQTDATLNLLDRLIQGGMRTSLVERGAMKVAADLARRAGRPDEARRFEGMIPESLEAEADWKAEEGKMADEVLLHQALVWYRNLGESEAFERVKRKLHEAGKQTRKNLESFPVEFSLDREEMEARVRTCLRRTRDLPEWAHLQVFALQPTLWPSWETVQRRREEWGAESPFSPFSDMMPISLIAPDGRPLSFPEDPDEQDHYRDIFTYRWMLQWNLPQAELEVALFREHDAWTEDLILNALASSPLFGEQDCENIRPGVRAYEDDRPWAAAHILFPRVEAAVRRLAERRGVDRHSFRDGRFELKSLGELLKQNAVEEVLNSLSPDFCDELRYALLHAWGLNLRNDLAHGIRSRNQVSSRDALLLVLILLALSVVDEGML